MQEWRILFIGLVQNHSHKTKEHSGNIKIILNIFFNKWNILLHLFHNFHNNYSIPNKKKILIILEQNWTFWMILENCVKIPELLKT